MVDVVLCLGTNLGNRALYMRRMEREVEKILLPPIKKSSLMETEPLGVTAGHPWYYNRLVRGGYAGAPRELLAACQTTEKKLGRTRPEKYAPRTADFDIILFGTSAVNEPDLVIPHRHIIDRRFCLEGLNEIAGEWIVPGTGKSIQKLSEEMRSKVQSQEIKVIEK
jgi:2-amino-4-hydroxy-6-hydroxymethyldihydropteridine diphosphokinase